MEKKLSNQESEQPESQRGNGEYYSVALAHRDVTVSRTMATFVEEQLNRRRPPKWITFVDLFGSRVRVLTSLIWAVAQSSEDQRAAAREFDRRFHQEWESDNSAENENR